MDGQPDPNEFNIGDNMITKGQSLETAKRYKVVHKEGNKTVKATRIFKWPEIRFGNIPCFVFTSKVNKSITASFLDNKLTITGKRIPRQEISIPIYDLHSFEEDS